MWTRHLTRRTQHAVLAAAAALGVWFGMSAPSTSPVSAVTPAPAAGVTDLAPGQELLPGPGTVRFRGNRR